MKRLCSGIVLAVALSGSGLAAQDSPSQALPFQDGTFDAVVCQFGVTFFSEKSRAAYQGTPLRNEIEVRNASRLGEATDIAAEAIAQRFGRWAVDGKIQAHIITIET